MPSVPPPPAAVTARSRWLALVAALALLLPVLPALQPAPAAAEVTDEQLAAGGVRPDLIRISVGLEDVEDILWDLDQAITAATGRTREEQA
jgi:hypothetical protein